MSVGWQDANQGRGGDVAPWRRGVGQGGLQLSNGWRAVQAQHLPEASQERPQLHHACFGNTCDQGAPVSPTLVSFLGCYCTRRYRGPLKTDSSQSRPSPTLDTELRKQV